MTDKQKFTSVWDAIQDTPQEAASMRARSALMINLSEVIREQGMTQAPCGGAVRGDAAPYLRLDERQVQPVLTGHPH